MPQPARRAHPSGLQEQAPSPSSRVGRAARATSRPVTALVLAGAVAVALAGCGGGSTDNTATPGSATETSTGTTLQLAADPTGKLEFTPTRLEAPAGRVTIVLTNDSSTPHDVAVVGNGVSVTSKVISDGEKASVSATLEPGTYEFYCTVPGHQDAGMQGVLVVS